MRQMHIIMLALLASVSVAATSAQADSTRSLLKAPPRGAYQPLSKLLPLPDYLPGMGTLYVDPATLPAGGPFLGYDHKGNLVNVIYMIPIKDLDSHKAFLNLGSAVAGLKINHTDMEFNPGHIGVSDPHYHITQWLISHDEELKRMP